MVVLSNTFEEISFVGPQKPPHYFTSIPNINLSDPLSAASLVEACQEFGFFKVTNHGVSPKLMTQLEEEAVKFFSMSESDKELAGPPYPFGYGSKTIGNCGDVGWVEYLLFEVASKPLSHPSLAFLREPSASLFRCALNEYLLAVRKVAIDLLEMMADGLGIKPRNVFSRFVADDESDSVFRINHYPCWPAMEGFGISRTGFGEHTDPKIISILRSNNSNGFQIALKDESWVSVAPDPSSFFVNVGDMLQVLTNGRFRSVKHRVLANGLNPRLSMIYFGGPQLREKIAPLPQLVGEEEQCHYREFTWEEYKRGANKSRLADNRLAMFEKLPTD